MDVLKTGNIFAAVYIVIMSLSVVWIDRLQPAFNESFLLLVVSLTAIIFYNAININTLKSTYQSIKIYPLQWFFMSFTFAMTWLLIYISAIHASPRAVIVLYYLTVAACGCISSDKLFYAICCIVAIVISFFIMSELNIATLVSSVACGLFGYAYMRSSASYAKMNNLKASQLLSIRFYLLLVISIGYILFIKHKQFIINVDSHTLFWVVSLVLLIVFNLTPTYYAQKSVVLIGTDKFSRIVATTPAATFFIQGVFENKWDIEVLILCVAVSLLLNCIAKA